MRVRVVFMVGALLAGAVVALAGPAEAGTINVITATGVGLTDYSTCGPNPLLHIEGTATGGSGLGEAQERGIASTLFDDDIGSFVQDSDGYGPGDFAFGYGLPLDDTYPVGTIIGLYAAVGDIGGDPETFAEWFVLYRCTFDGTGAELLYSCFGEPLGTCPATASAAQDLIFEVEVSDTAPDPGETITAVAGECLGETGSLRLVEGPSVLDEVDGIPVDADGTVVADLTVPASIAPGTELDVIGECYLDDVLIAEDVVPVTVAGEVPTTTTVAPTTVAPAPPPAPVARPVAQTPAFTG